MMMRSIQSRSPVATFQSLPGRHATCGARRGAFVGRRALQVCNVAAAPPMPATMADPEEPRQPGQADLSEAPPFTLADLKNAIPAHLYKKDTSRSVMCLVRDVAIVVGMAAAAYTLNSWWVWPAYWLAQGTMFWALFVVGHDCGHGSFSNDKKLNDLIGNITHASILVPYHGWRISHRTHHANHGHVVNDESWYPTTSKLYDSMGSMQLLGRLTFPISMLAFPFYLLNRSPGKEGSHYDPKADLFSDLEAPMIETSNRFMLGFIALLVAGCFALGPVAMLKLYMVPYWVNVMWLDAVTYLHHHGPDERHAAVPWYRGKEWSYLRGGLSTLDRDYGIFNKIHHSIGTHVVHHLLPQIPHYNLDEATAAVKPVMGPYYREPEVSGGPIPFHLVKSLARSFSEDHFVSDSGDVVYYQKDPNFWQKVKRSFSSA